MKKEVPARLHVLLARHSPMAVVIRRGPAKQVCTLSWNRENDTFEMGQWLKGRIYEERCDLSPDGKYLLYFALKGQDTWTAISRVPWLKAIEFYPACGTWEGGGRFVTENRFWLNGSHYGPLTQSDEVLRIDDHELGDQLKNLPDTGWDLFSDYLKSSPVYGKSLPDGWILRKLDDSSVRHKRKKHELINKNSRTRIQCDDWEWADWDRDSLVWASRGCLYRAPIENSKTIGTPKLLYDFNPLKFEAIEAPY